MKVKVLKPFKDKQTKQLHKKGETITVSHERYDEINSTSHGKFVTEIQDTPRNNNPNPRKPQK